VSLRKNFLWKYWIRSGNAEKRCAGGKIGCCLFFGGFIAYIVVFLCFNGGMHPAIDLTAGEKERGTMETILSSPIARSHLVIGKFLLVFTTALSTAALP